MISRNGAAIEGNCRKVLPSAKPRDPCGTLSQITPARHKWLQGIAIEAIFLKIMKVFGSFASRLRHGREAHFPKKQFIQRDGKVEATPGSRRGPPRSRRARAPAGVPNLPGFSADRPPDVTA